LISSDLLQQEIAQSSNEATRRYKDETLKMDSSDLAVTSAMEKVAKTKATSFRRKFSKYTVVANPKLSDSFLEDVLSLNQFY
jgi:hypothetical protein